MNTKLGPKGYTILKSELTLEKQNWVRQQLTVKPHTPGAPVQNASTFSAWLENESKIYVPRYFGEKHFGIAKTSSLPMGDPIHLAFAGTLRDYQIPVVEQYLDYVRDDAKCGLTGGRGGLLDLYPAWGKTSSALYILSKLKTKALVVVGKEFLMTQWEERIGQFLPGARVGKIQGSVFDIENKDIVLVMIQSLVSKNKKYPPELFASFGMTIFDEVHHASSECFSRSLFTLVTRYMIGLSGTMDRKDGTTDIFKMFLGEVVHKAKRPPNDMAVEVRKITYLSHDPAFEEDILDFRGKPQISSMISKLCEYNRRTEFVLKVLKDFVQAESSKKRVEEPHGLCVECKRPEIFPMQTSCCFQNQSDGSKKKANSGFHQPFGVRCIACWDAYERDWEHNYTVTKKRDPTTGKLEEQRHYPYGKQIKCPYCEKKLKHEQNYVDCGNVKPYMLLQTIVMSHNISVLRYMYRVIVSTNMCSTGFYIGGMSPEELKKSETKHVLLGSFSMTSEGLDIFSLNAEFLISPKTDIEQIVGRILRSKHAITSPVIYDFVDTHDTFKRQWSKRKKYYKQNEFKIVETTSDLYGKTKPNNAFDNDDKCKDKDDSDEESDNPCKSNGILKGTCFFNLKKMVNSEK